MIYERVLVSPGKVGYLLVDSWEKEEEDQNRES